ncbi:MAG: hypothetical protein WBC91_09505 [Phototrophicaceae bacterium]
MIAIIIRRMSILLIIMITLLMSLIHLSQRPNNRATIQQFLTAPDTCERQPCFLGIIPEESEQEAVYSALANASIVEDIRLAQIEFGLRQLFIQWNGEQPHFIVDEGYITLVGGRAETIELTTELLLGDIVAVFGEPSHIIIATFDVYLYYAETGLVVESRINCDAVWYSSVTILWQPRVNLDNLSSDTVTLKDACD